MQKARCHTVKNIVLQLLVGLGFQVLFHSPQRGTFHLSLTVLVHYRSSTCIQPWKMVLPDSDRVSRVPPYSGTNFRSEQCFHIRDYHPLWSRFQYVLLTCSFVTSGQAHIPNKICPTTPHRQRMCPITSMRFRLYPVRSPLLGASQLISLPPGTQMFQFPGFALINLCIQFIVTQLSLSRVSPFGHPWIIARLATPHGFSQPSTSFFASRYQGIHH